MEEELFFNMPAIPVIRACDMSIVNRMTGIGMHHFFSPHTNSNTFRCLTENWYRFNKLYASLCGIFPLNIAFLIV